MERPQSIDFLQIRSAPESINATVDFIRLHARPFFRSLGLIVVLPFIVGFLGRIFTEGGSEASVLLVLLFFVPAFIYVLASWSLFFPVRLIEEEAFFDSLGRSQSLVRDRRWKTFGFVLGLGALLLVLQLSFRLPLTIIEFLLEMNVLSSYDLSELWYSITAGFATVLASAGSIVCYAAMTLAVIFYYYSQLERTDALSLNLAISRIGVPNNLPSGYVTAGRHSPVADIPASGTITSGTIASGRPGTNANDDADTMPEAPVA